MNRWKTSFKNIFLISKKDDESGYQKQKEKRFYFSPENEEVPESSENINPQAVRRIREYVELNYGKSYLSESEQARVNRKFCTGIHKNCILYLTDGILQNPVIKNNQYRFSQLQFEKIKPIMEIITGSSKEIFLCWQSH